MCILVSMLTDRSIRFEPAADKIRYLADGRGLYLKISPKGLKTWAVRRQGGAKDRWKTIGHYPSMTLRNARIKAAEMMVRGFSRVTVDEAFREYRSVLKRDYKRAQDIERRFDTDILPVVGSKYLEDVTRLQISNLLGTIVKRGSPVAANRTLPDIQHFFAWCAERGWITESPAKGITRKSVGGRERARERALTLTELKAFIAVLLTTRFHLKTRLALGIAMLTGQR